MLKFVKMRLTSKDVSGTMFTFEGTNIPEHLLLYIIAKQIKAESTPAESLKLLRTTFGYTQQQLADKVGITKQQISAMERGREPIGRKMAHRLANALGTSYKNLFW